MNVFKQKDYAALITALDTALTIFSSIGLSEKDAQAALQAFVVDHYFKVWRGMATVLNQPHPDAT